MAASDFKVQYHHTFISRRAILSIYSYPGPTFELISQVLVQRAASLGANAFAVRDEVIEADLAVDDIGPLTWALAIHADALARMGGHSTAQHNRLPFTMIENPDSPFGNQCVIKEGEVAMAIAFQYLDAALEHCICMAMKHFSMLPSEWDALPYNEKVIPIEPYIEDLQKNWVSDLLESNERSALAINFPVLFTRSILEEHTANERMQQAHTEPKPSISRPVSFGSMG